jgi:hypothetical protein
MTDTDSLLVTVSGYANGDEVMEKLNSVMDTSNYPKDHALYDDTRKNQVTFWKDELCGNKLVEFVGLCSKTYAMTVRQKSSDKLDLQTKCKGVRKGFRKKIPMSAFRKCIEGLSSESVTQYAILGRDHRLYTVKNRKRAFSSFDDKRFVLPCGVHTLAHGNVRIKTLGNDCPFCSKNVLNLS